MAGHSLWRPHDGCDAAVMARPIEADALAAEQFESVPVFEEELALITPRGQHPVAMARESAGLTPEQLRARPVEGRWSSSLIWVMAILGEKAAHIAADVER